MFISTWIKFENDGLYLFGEGGITRVEPFTGYDAQQKKVSGSVLYSGITRVTVTSYTLEQIQELLERAHGQ